jgi:hypothetical protein
MTIIKKSFTEIGSDVWDTHTRAMGYYSHLHLSHSLDYYLGFSNVENVSFVVLENNKCVAVVPLAISGDLLIFGDLPCPSPLVSTILKESKRRKIYNSIFREIDKIMLDCEITSYVFSRHSFQSNKEHGCLCSENLFELLKYSHDTKLSNTLVMDLRKNETTIEMGFSKYHRRNINKSKKLGISHIVLSKNSDINDIDTHFKKYKEAHFIAANGSTRPDLTWSIMKRHIIKGFGELLVAQINDINISYLFCGNVDGFSWGWSQVNIKEFEKEYMPRHYLEWMAMLYYKSKNTLYYDIGDRFYPLKSHKISRKELSIADFKEKYGASVYPKITFTRHLKEIENN